MVIVVMVAAAAAAAPGCCVVRRSLHPLSDITAAAQRVTVSGLHDLIGEEPWPRDLVSLATEFDGMLGRLRSSFEHLFEFTADAAHEFRTPLNNLLARPVSLSRVRARLKNTVPC